MNKCHHKHKKIEVQQSLKAMLESLKYSKEFDMISKRKHKTEMEKHIPKQTGTPVDRTHNVEDTADCYINQENAWHMARPAVTMVN